MTTLAQTQGCQRIKRANGPHGAGTWQGRDDPSGQPPATKAEGVSHLREQGSTAVRPSLAGSTTHWTWEPKLPGEPCDPGQVTHLLRLGPLSSEARVPREQSTGPWEGL